MSLVLDQSKKIGRLEGFIESSLNPLDIAMWAANNNDIPLLKDQLKYAVQLLKKGLRDA